MLSRVANELFWMSRYIERAENVARFIEVNQNLTLDVGELNGRAAQWQPLVDTTGDHDLFREHYGVTTRRNVLDFLTFDTRNPNSILSCLQRARENARAVREHLSTAMWNELNKYYLSVRNARGTLVEHRSDFLGHVIAASHAVLGATEVTMAHGDAWNFCRMGRLLERADKTSRILDVKYFILLPTPADVGTTKDIVQWSALLKSTSALEMYRRRHGRIEPAKVAGFLIRDPEFPRSMYFCVETSMDSLRTITGSHRMSFQNRAEQLLGRLSSELGYTRIEDIIGRGLHEYIDEFQRRLNEIGTSIHECFFTTGSTTKDDG